MHESPQLTTVETGRFQSKTPNMTEVPRDHAVAPERPTEVNSPGPDGQPQVLADESLATTLAAGVSVDEAVVTDGVEVRRGWPTLFKKTTGGKTQEWQVWVERTPEGYGRIHTKYGLQDGKKQEQTDVVESGKNRGKRNETTPYQQAVLEAEAEWKKQLERKGYGRDVERSAEVRGSSPMLAHPFDKVKPAEIDWANAYAQPKLDGFRCLATRGDDGKVSLRSRENKPILTMPHIVAALEASRMPGGVTLDGELYVHGTPFQVLASWVKKLRPESAQVQYHVYDVMGGARFAGGEGKGGVVAAGRFGRLTAFVEFMPKPHPVRLVETVVVRSIDELMAYQAEQVAAGYEGAMLRHTELGYEAGKRSKTLLKVKNFKDEEFEVVAVREGRGTHKGLAIFLCNTAAGTTFEVTAPGGHWEKQQYWLNRKKCVGARLTVKFFEYTTGADPVPRFPVGLRFKDEPFEMPPNPEAGLAREERAAGREK